MAGLEERTAGDSFVGRDRELARVAGLLDEARAGRGRLVLCTGEAGIGKTRFAEEVAAAAAARGVAVIWARSADPDSSPPYGLWRLAWPELPGHRPGEPDAGPGLDLWSLVFGGSAGRALGSGSELDRGQRFALFSEVRQRLAQAAEPDGLLLVLDDIQLGGRAVAAPAGSPGPPAAGPAAADRGHMPQPARRATGAGRRSGCSRRTRTPNG